MRAGFLLDMGISPRVASVLAEYGYKSLHTSNISLGTATDEDILLEATRRGMVVITTDKDLSRHLALGRASEPSVITLRLDNPSAEKQISAIRGLLESLRPEDLEKCLITLKGDRYRRRDLPLR